MGRGITFKKDKIVKAAFVVLRKKGIHHFNARNIAEALDCSTSPIYYHFESLSELEDAMVEKMIGIFLRPIKHLPDYYTFENLALAFCLFAKNHRRLFEEIFLTSNVKFENELRTKLYAKLNLILKKDTNFDFEKDSYKLLVADALALRIHNSFGEKTKDEEILPLIKHEINHYCSPNPFVSF